MTDLRRVKRDLWAWKTRTMSRPFPARVRHHVRNIAACLLGGALGKAGRLPLGNIRHLHIVLSRKCNQRCRMCYQADFLRDLDPNIVYRKLLRVYPHLDEIILQGGEPTAIPGTREFMDFVLGQNPRVRFSLLTNGVMFDRSWSDFFIKHGKSVNFSLNAARPETYGLISRPNRWERIIENLRALRAGRGTEAAVEITASFVILWENLGELAAFVDLGRDLGLDRIRFFFDPHLLPPDREAVRRALDEAATAATRSGAGLKVEGLARFEAFYFGRKADPPVCSSPFDTLFVDAGGESGLCCQMNRMIGDLRFSSVEKIWQGAPANRLRKAFRNGDYRSCGHYCRPLP